uniref:MRP-like transporter n=1 Tax=Ganoderma boninense TaxID=34458 RepID=A0A5K1K0Q5_9APHY|nr:MRP-like transporter [Ganoderma boninense]
MSLSSSAIPGSLVTRVYESETYDYPTQIQESLTEFGTTIGTGITNFAAANLKGTNLPTPAPVSPAAPQHKTLPHAIGRAATTAALAVHSTSAVGKGKLGKALGERFLQPWQTTLSTSIAVAMKARQAVRVSRLELDAAKQTLKNSSQAKQEAARLEVENAEDDLVQKTEVAITLMKTVLENVRAQMFIPLFPV